eukprot:361674-Chlamydomonas_euryale.AAC.1
MLRVSKSICPELQKAYAPRFKKRVPRYSKSGCSEFQKAYALSFKKAWQEGLEAKGGASLRLGGGASLRLCFGVSREGFESEVGPKRCKRDVAWPSMFGIHAFGNVGKTPQLTQPSTQKPGIAGKKRLTSLSYLPSHERRGPERPLRRWRATALRLPVVCQIPGNFPSTSLDA